jgi:hypothetical protein
MALPTPSATPRRAGFRSGRSERTPAPPPYEKPPSRILRVNARTIHVACRSAPGLWRAVKRVANEVDPNSASPGNTASSLGASEPPAVTTGGSTEFKPSKPQASKPAAVPIRAPTEQEKEVLRMIELAKQRPNSSQQAHGWTITMTHRARRRGKHVGAPVKELHVQAPDGTKLASKLGVQRHMGILDGGAAEPKGKARAARGGKEPKPKRAKKKQKRGDGWTSTNDDSDSDHDDDDDVGVHELSDEEDDEGTWDPRHGDAECASSDVPTDEDDEDDGGGGGGGGAREAFPLPVTSTPRAPDPVMELFIEDID